MQKVVVRGADGVKVPLAFVRRAGHVVYVCAENRYTEVLAGSDDPIVGFPIEDVEGLPALDLAGH